MVYLYRSVPWPIDARIFLWLNFLLLKGFFFVACLFKSPVIVLRQRSISLNPVKSVYIRPELIQQSTEI